MLRALVALARLLQRQALALGGANACVLFRRLIRRLCACATYAVGTTASLCVPSQGACLWVCVVPYVAREVIMCVRVVQVSPADL